MRSASSRRVLGAVAAAGFLAGCSTTQQQAARLRLNDARIRASQVPTRVTPAEASPTVHAVRVGLVRSSERTAIVVTVRNDGARPAADLPIAVGYGARTLNAAAGVAYFAAHLPLIRPHAEIDWVYLAARPVPARARLYARIGARADPAVPLGPSPSLSATARLTSRGWRVRVSNRSDITQYDLPVYAVAADGATVRAAGVVTIAELDPGASQTVPLRLIGTGSGPVRATATPSIFN